MKNVRALIVDLAALLAAPGAFADVTIGVTINVSIPLTGPTSALGIPSKNGIELWPKTIAGEQLKVIILDDRPDPAQPTRPAA